MGRNLTLQNLWQIFVVNYGRGQQIILTQRHCYHDYHLERKLEESLGPGVAAGLQAAAVLLAAAAELQADRVPQEEAEEESHHHC